MQSDLLREPRITEREWETQRQKKYLSSKNLKNYHMKNKIINTTSEFNIQNYHESDINFLYKNE